jgi:uncharacterized membrane protein
MKIGVWIYGLATIVTGILDLVWGSLEPSHQPIQALGQQVAGEHLLAYIAGAWLTAAGIAILWRPTERIGAALSTSIYFIFALLWIPRLYMIVHMFGFRIGAVVFGVGGIGGELLFIAPAAFLYAASETSDPTSDPVWRKRASIAGRWMLGVPPMLFGLGHLVSLSAYLKFIPHWIPFQSFWIVLTGIAFMLAGIAIVSGIQDVLAARLLALMLLLFEASVEIPPVFAQPHSQTAWGGAVYNLTAIGVCWVFAEFILNRRKADGKETSASSRIVPLRSNSAVA